jgi:hypothetical protein
MIHNIPKPDISPDFTIEDIHKIRAWNYERLKDATPEERKADTERRAAEARKKYGLKPGFNAPQLSTVAVQ